MGTSLGFLYGAYEASKVESYIEEVYPVLQAKLDVEEAMVSFLSLSICGPFKVIHG